MSRHVASRGFVPHRVVSHHVSFSTPDLCQAGSVSLSPTGAGAPWLLCAPSCLCPMPSRGRQTTRCVCDAGVCPQSEWIPSQHSEGDATEAAVDPFVRRGDLCIPVPTSSTSPADDLREATQTQNFRLWGDPEKVQGCSRKTEPLASFRYSR